MLTTMPIPDYQSLMLPLLEILQDKQVWKVADLADALAERFEVSPEERRELLPSGRQATFDNRVGWARTYLKKAGLVSSPKRGYAEIIDRGLEVLQQNPEQIDVKFLGQFSEFQAFRNGYQKTEIQAEKAEKIEESSNPEEALDPAHQQLRQNLAEELLEMVRGCAPDFFEKLVVELLVKMGYGGSLKDAGQSIGRSGDGGIDGIIKEDRLGLDVIYVQAKRWEGTVGRPEIQKFAGALQGQRARKGVFITASQFSREAKDYVSQIDNKIVLIDGEQLAYLMIDYDLGVSKIGTYEIKRLDSDYFDQLT